MSVPESHAAWARIVGDVGVYTLAFALTNIASYAYLVLIGRTISAGQFGVFNSLFGLISILGVVATSVQVAVTKAGAARQSRRTFNLLLKRVWKGSLALSALLLVLGVALGHLIGAAVGDIVIAVLVVLAMLVSSAVLGVLGALTLVRSQAIINFVGTMVRLSTGLLLLLNSVAASNALFGYVLNYVAVFLLAYICMSRRVPATEHTFDERWPCIRLAPGTVATVVLTYIPFTMDQIAVQSLVPQSGDAYAGLATVSKIVFYAGFPVLGVFYPKMVAERHESQRQRLVAGAIGTVALLSSIALVALATFPEQLIHILFGGRYREVVPYVPTLGLGIAFFSMSVLCTHALIAWNGRLTFLPSLIAVGVGSAFFAEHHSNIAQVVQNMVVTYSIQVSLTLVLLWCAARQSRNRARSTPVGSQTGAASH